MKKVNKKGFTLVEVMLSIAIITIISGLFVALLVAIRSSFYTTYNTNDATDYAALYAQALENVVIRDVQNNYASGEITYYIDNSSASSECEFHRKITGGADTTLFTLAQLRSGTDIKWRIYLTQFESVGKDTYAYTFHIVDNYYDPGKLELVYSGTFWVPHMQGGTLTAQPRPSVFKNPSGGTVTGTNIALFTRNEDGTFGNAGNVTPLQVVYKVS